MGSTMFSCAAACYIEKGANQMIYRYFPHKFADVEAASGITQEQLDAVRIPIQPVPAINNRTSSVAEQEIQELIPAFHIESDVDDRTTTIKKEISPTNNNKTIFWIERREEKGGVNVSSSLTIAVDLPRQEILACAMTC